jgi:hypothetical protein
MTYLRFSPEDYRALCRFCSPHLTFARDLPAFRQLLLFALSETRPALAERIAALDGRRLRILHDHFAGRATAGRAEAQEHGLGPKEMYVLWQACRCYPGTARFLQPLKSRLVEVLKDVVPALSEKLSRMSDDQFERLYEQVARRKKGSA